MNHPTDAKTSILLLDLGGVLVDLGDPAKAMNLEMTSDEFWDIWLGAPIVHQFESGRLSLEQFLIGFGPLIGDSDPAEFGNRIARWQLRVFDGMPALLATAAKSYRLALLSNTNELHWQSVLSQTRVFSKFSGLFLSFELGCLKPSHEIFEVVLDKLQCGASELVFLDDTAKNVQAAKERGIEALRVKGYQEVETAINGLLSANCSI